MDQQHLANLAHLRRARDLVDREYARPLDVPAMARHALMSPGHFSRAFRVAYGETPYTYLMTQKPGTVSIGLLAQVFPTVVVDAAISRADVKELRNRALPADSAYQVTQQAERSACQATRTGCACHFSGCASNDRLRRLLPRRIARSLVTGAITLDVPACARDCDFCCSGPRRRFARARQAEVAHDSAHPQAGPASRRRRAGHTAAQGRRARSRSAQANRWRLVGGSCAKRSTA